MFRNLAALFLFFLSSAVSASPSTFDTAWGNGGTLDLPAGRTVARLDPQPGGSILAIGDNSFVFSGEESRGFITRVTSDGRVDPTYAGGALAFECTGGHPCATRVSTDPQGRVWMLSPQTATLRDIEVRRLLPDGSPDASFGQGGVLRIRSIDYCLATGCPFSLDIVVSIATFASGRALLVVDCSIAPPNATYGSCLIGVSDAGIVEWIRPVAEFFQSFSPTPAIPAGPDGSAFIAGTVFDPAIVGNRIGILKVLADGNVDTTFGNAGIAMLSLPVSARSIVQFSPAPEGGALMLLSDFTPTFGDSALFVRVKRDGSLDAAFGGGIVKVQEFVGASFAMSPDGSVLAAGQVAGQAALLRLRSDGSRESRFGGQGIVTFAFKGGAGALGLALKTDGRIVVGGYTNVDVRIVPGGTFGGIPVPRPVRSPLLFQVLGGLDAFDRFWLEVTAVEYFHPGFGHYFVSAFGAEQSGLDLAKDQAWVRTGKQFNVWYQPAPELAETCRFWSDQTFAPRSSHFYTPYAAECAALRAGSVWRYEGIAFYLRLPEGVPGARVCPAGSRPLYRAYNNGQGGAPNHRYTADIATLDAMVAQGWIAEGEGQARIFACAPASN
jgi:uncharacterized delta-60 repeat protein